MLDPMGPIDFDSPQDPFAYIMKQTLVTTFTTVTPATMAALFAFLILHTVIALACLTVLLLPYLRGKRAMRASHWMVKKLYLAKDPNHTDESTSQSGRPESQTAFSKPLFLLNSGVLIALAQLIDSCITQAYILIQLRTFISAEYSKHANLVPFLGLLYGFEFYTNWFMAWFASLTSYLYEQNLSTTKLKAPHHFFFIRPLFFNTFFTLFPILVTGVDITITLLLVGARNHRVATVKQLGQTLLQGSSIWRQSRLQGSWNNRIGQHDNLNEVTLNVQAQTKAVLASTNNSMAHLRLFAYVWTPILSATCFVFVLALWKLLNQLYQRLHFSSWPIENPCLSPGSNMLGELGNQRASLPATMKSRLKAKGSLRAQFYLLLLRAFAMLLSMLSSICVLILMMVKTHDLATSPSWRANQMWFVLCSGTLSAVPITFQCLVFSGGCILMKNGGHQALAHHAHDHRMRVLMTRGDQHPLKISN